MKVKVRIPLALRDAAGGKPLVDVSASTVREAVEAISRLFPPIAERIQAPDGTTKKSIGLYLNRNDVRFLRGPDTALSDGDEVMILLPASGG